MSTSSPNDFWDKVKHLGPRKDRSIPVEIHEESGHVIRDENIAFGKGISKIYIAAAQVVTLMKRSMTMSNRINAF